MKKESSIAEVVQQVVEAFEAEDYCVTVTNYSTFTDVSVSPTGDTSVELQVQRRGTEFCVTGFHFPDPSGQWTTETELYWGHDFDAAVDAALVAAYNLKVGPDDM